MDHNVKRAITVGLRSHGIDVLTAYEDRSHKISDPDLLDRAAVLKRVLFSRDQDLLIEASRRQRSGVQFYGVVFAHQDGIQTGECIRELQILASVGQIEDVLNRVLYLPL